GVNRNDKRTFIESDDFTHDVRLYVDGDFADQDEKLAYALGIADQLNAASQPVKPSRGEQRIEWLREVRECAEHVATSDYYGIDAAISKLMSVVERWPQPAESIVSDVEAIVRLLERREWADHVATTPLGQRIE